MKLAINGGKAVIENKVKEKWKNITDDDAELVKEYVINNEISVIDRRNFKRI